jgi:hypothetical protein
MKHADYEGKEHRPLHCDECWDDSLRVREVVALETIAESLIKLISVAYIIADLEPAPKPEPKPYYQAPLTPTIKVPEIHRRGL